MCSECLFNENTEYTAFGFFLKNLLLEINSNKYVGINDMIINKSIRIIIVPYSMLAIGSKICKH